MDIKRKGKQINEVFSHTTTAAGDQIAVNIQQALTNQIAWRDVHSRQKARFIVGEISTPLKPSLFRVGEPFKWRWVNDVTVYNYYQTYSDQTHKRIFSFFLCTNSNLHARNFLLTRYSSSLDIQCCDSRSRPLHRKLCHLCN